MYNLFHSLTELEELPNGTVAIDLDGDAWQKNGILDRWIVVGIDDKSPYVDIEDYFPMKVVYAPDED